MEFASAVDALGAAIEFQQAMAGVTGRHADDAAEGVEGVERPLAAI